MIPDSPSPTAGALMIGNELLSGRTREANLAPLAAALEARGIRLIEARLVRDEEPAIIEALDALRARLSYVFTTGGIGPTHDDITARAVARAFGRPVVRNAEAEAALRAHYPAEKITESRLCMANMPEGATLVPNNVSGAPGFRIDNVFVLAGVPAIAEDMIRNVVPGLAGGVPLTTASLRTALPESSLAADLAGLQARHPELEIGCYPFYHPEGVGTNVVIRGEDPDSVAAAEAEISARAAALEES